MNVTTTTNKLRRYLPLGHELRALVGCYSLEVVFIGGVSSEQTYLPVAADGHRSFGHVRPTRRPVAVQDRGATQRHQSVLSQRVGTSARHHTGIKKQPQTRRARNTHRVTNTRQTKTAVFYGRVSANRLLERSVQSRLSLRRSRIVFLRRKEKNWKSVHCDS